MKKTALFSLLVLTAACGGSGGSSSSVNTQSANSTTPVESVKNTLKVKVEHQDYCGNKTVSSDARLIIHNADFTNKEVTSPDEDGVMSYESTDDMANVSVVYPGITDNEGIVELRVKTLLEQPLIDIGSIIVKTGDKTQCSCQNVDLKVDSDSDLLTGNFDVKVNAWQNIPYEYTDTGILIKDQEVCHANSENFGDKLVTITAPYYGGSVAAYKKAYQVSDVLTTEYQGEAFDFDVIGSGMSTDRMYEVRSAGQVIQRDFSWGDSTPFYYYPLNGADKFIIRAWEYENLYIDGIGDVYFQSSTSKIYQPNQNNDIVLVELDSEEFSDAISSNSNSYDFSRFEQFDLFYMGFSGYAENGKRAFWWGITMPLSGNIPELSNIDIDGIIANWNVNDSLSRVEANVMLDGYSEVHGYQDYMQNNTTEYSYLANESRWDVNNYIWMSFDIPIENVGILSANIKSPTNVISEVVNKIVEPHSIKKIPSSIEKTKLNAMSGGQKVR